MKYPSTTDYLGYHADFSFDFIYLISWISVFECLWLPWSKQSEHKKTLALQSYAKHSFVNYLSCFEHFCYVAIALIITPYIRKFKI